MRANTDWWVGDKKKWKECLVIPQEVQRSFLQYNNKYWSKTNTVMPEYGSYYHVLIAFSIAC